MIKTPDSSRMLSRIILVLLFLRTCVLFGQVPEGTPIRNIANFSYHSSGGISYSAATNQVELAVAAGSQLEIQKSADASVILPGDTVIYHIRVTNTGNITELEYHILDTLASGLELIATFPNAAIHDNVIDWSMTNLASGASHVVDLHVRAGPTLPFGLGIENRAWYTSSDGRSGSSGVITVTTGEAPALTLNLSSNKAIAQLGDTLVYDISIKNTGNLASTGTSLLNNLPPYIAFISASHGATNNQGIINWALGDIEAGGVRTETVTLVVAAFAPINTSITSNFQVSNHEGVESSKAISTLINPWSLPISKSAEPGEYEPGDTIRYSITLDNNSQWTIQGIVLRDTLPQEVSFISATAGAYFSDPVVTWSLGSMEPYTSRTVFLETRLDLQEVLSADIVNFASVETYNGGTNRASHTISIQRAPELTLSKSAPATVSPGEVLTYSLAFENIGQGHAIELSLVDTLPAEVRLLTASHSYTYDEISHLVEFALPDLAVSQRDTVTISTELLPLIANGTQIRNAAMIFCAGNVQSLASATTVVSALAELDLENHAEAYLVPGDTVHYVINYANSGNGIATAVTVRDTLSTLLAFIGGSGSPDYDPISRLVSWQIGQLNPEMNGSISFMARVAKPLPPGTILTNSATISSNEGVFNSAEVSSIIRAPVLTVSLTANSGVALPGEGLTYTITYANAGDTTATGLVAIDSLPPEVSFLSASGDGEYDPDGHVVRWILADLLPGSTGNAPAPALLRRNMSSQTAVQELRIDVQVNAPLANGTEIRNAVLIQSEEGSEASTSLNINVASGPDLSLSISAESHLVPGDTVHYEIDYANSGNGIATAVTVRDTLSTLLAFIGGSGSPDYDPISRLVSWQIGQLNPEMNGSISFMARVAKPLPPGTILTNSATISSNEGVFNSAEVSSIIRAPVLTVSLTANSGVALPGEGLTYTITYANAGDTTATGLVAIDSLPPEVSFLSASGDGEYDPDGHVVRWILADLLPGSTGNAPAPALLRRNMSSQTAVQELRIDVQVNAPLANGTEIRNAVLIQSEEGSEASTSLNINVASGPDLQLAVWADQEIFPLDTIHYQVTYMNAGTDQASDVKLLDTLSGMLSFVSASGPYVYDPVERILTWNLGQLASMESGSQNISVITDALFEEGTNIQNNLWITSAETAPFLAQSSTTNILPMSLTLTAQPTQILGNAISSSSLRADVMTYSGNPIPNGIQVSFTTDQGTINPDQLNVATLNGVAFSTLISDTVADEIVRATVTARASYSPTQFALDSAVVAFARGAIEGTVRDYQGSGVSDVQVDLQVASSGQILASTSTDESGYYFIFFPRNSIFNLVFTFTDEQGNTYSITQPLTMSAPKNGGVVTNNNAISGWVRDAVTGEIVLEEGIQLILQRMDDGLLKSGEAGSSDTTYTNSTGAYFFGNLSVGQYRMTLNYHGINSYGDGWLDINFPVNGLFVFNANIAVRQSQFYIYKTVDQVEASIGDTLTYSVHYGPTQMGSSDTLYIVDYLPQGLAFLESSLEPGSELVLDYYSSTTNEIVFHRVGLGVNETPVLTFKALISPYTQALSNDLENTALITDHVDSTYSVRNTRSIAVTRIVHPFLKLTKRVNRRVVETGDILTYSVEIMNTSMFETAYNLNIVDLLPRGFTYRTGGSRWQGQLHDDPVVRSSTKHRTELTWVLSDTLQPGVSFEMKYRVICGIDAREGTCINEVQAFAQTEAGFQIQSNHAEASVVLQRGLFSDRGLLIGKVFYDDNRNGRHDKGEKTPANVELFTETGIRVTTDDFGKYSIPDLAAGMHAIRVNLQSLPAGAAVILDSPDQLGDADSKIFWVKSGGIAKVNFSIMAKEIRAEISGHIYHDENNNQIFDPGENLYLVTSLLLDDSIRVTTDSTGHYSFTNVALGAHRLTLDPEEHRVLDDASVKEFKTSQISTHTYSVDVSEDLIQNLPLMIRKRLISLAILPLGPEGENVTDIESAGSESRPARYYLKCLNSGVIPTPGDSLDLEVDLLLPEPLEVDSLVIKCDLPEFLEFREQPANEQQWSLMVPEKNDRIKMNLELIVQAAAPEVQFMAITVQLFHRGEPVSDMMKTKAGLKIE